MIYGFNSDGPHLVSVGKKPTKAYSRWATMMARCYNPSNQAYAQYGGAGVSVAEDWHDFQVFAQWFSENQVDGWVMDKDCSGAKVYSRDTVIFVPDQVNQLLKCYFTPGCGVGKATKTWYVKSNDVDGKQHLMGKFKTQEAANDYYQDYIRLKMVALVEKYSIPAATAGKLLSL